VVLLAFAAERRAAQPRAAAPMSKISHVCTVLSSKPAYYASTVNKKTV